MAGTGTGAGGRRGSAGTGAGKAAALARLLHQDCSRLLDLYMEREAFLSEVTVAQERIVTPSPALGRLPPSEQLRLLHSALQQCLGLLQDVMARENEDFGVDDKGEYGRLQNTVKDRLEHLLGSTKLLLVSRDGTAALTPAREVTDGLEKGNSFSLKVWIYRVLQELIHWMLTAWQTLQALQSRREKEPARAARRGRRGKDGLRK
ncbi:hypothetical protein GN956_G12862 [Arapaima gigas]